MEPNVCFYPLKTLIGRQCSFQKQNQLSQVNKVLDAPTYFERFIGSFIHLNRTFLNKGAFIPLENPEGQAVFLSKTNLILTGKQSAIYSTFYHRWFSFKRDMCFFNLAE
jgi:hypothetical protein